MATLRKSIELTEKENEEFFDNNKHGATCSKSKWFLQARKEMIEKNPKKQCRMRGTSTAQALEAIAEAIRNPNSKIELIDHAADYAYGANEHLMQITASIIELLHLEGFTFDKNKNRNKNWYLEFSFEPKLGDK